MGELRKIEKVIAARPTVEGAGVRLRRAIGFADPRATDPFLLLDDFRSDRREDYEKGFPWHPHRGMETITYMLRGEVEHGDSLGNSGSISAGDVQWMTAGSGILHQEMPKGDAEGSMHGFQLWANLPASDKMTEPRYRGFGAAEIPEALLPGGVKARVIAGSAGDAEGPVRDVAIEPEYLDLSLPPGSSFAHPVPRGRRAFAYVIGGGGRFCGQGDPFSYEAAGEGYFDMKPAELIGDGRLVLFGDGDSVSAQAGEEGLRFLLVSGWPIGESIAWYGPIVMNTREELRIAYEELEKGTFIKARKT